MTKLKPCPFCGEDAEFSATPSNWYGVRCRRVLCFAYKMGDLYPGKKAAAKAWNTRVGDEDAASAQD